MLCLAHFTEIFLFLRNGRNWLEFLAVFSGLTPVAQAPPASLRCVCSGPACAKALANPHTLKYEQQPPLRRKIIVKSVTDFLLLFRRVRGIMDKSNTVEGSPVL